MSEKELYSKICVVQGIKPVVSEARDEVVEENTLFKISCNLATILARDKEVVAVRLKTSDGCKAYLSKNGPWLDEDFVYISKIMEYLRNMSKDPLNESEANSAALITEILSYCSNKLGSRIKKLRNDLIRDKDKKYIKSFIKYASNMLKEFDPKKLNDVDKSKISVICQSYYEQLDETYKNKIPEKHLGHLRKVGSYIASVVNLKICASSEKYKVLFSNIELCILKPTAIKTGQPIYSWECVIRSFVPNNVDYERFKDKCLNDEHIKKRLKMIYPVKKKERPDEKSGQPDEEIQLNDDNIKIRAYLHAEMNILVNMIDQEDKSKAFIALSKRCCYLCELYINFARKRGYNIIVSGNHRKIYRGWKFPQVTSNSFRIGSLKYILANLDRVIDNKIKHYTESLDTDSDSSVGSEDFNDDVYDHKKKCVYRLVMGYDP
ncbi:hypothetical protein RclHR1_03800012 [Rhizophagus clarus]|uniref:Uncharacterized protein n=1 Tax=Rhizophagus clarus TaxID=94130 RepID=A0A2Z6RCQ6_9GLOM|nr:hypothetical protein RclHR1_03800012 [Rhizophagus clarus]GES76919.1 hypothetical protein GLOIN_2v1776273 [Rhizophagus clarus]